MSAPAPAGTQRRIQALMARAWSAGTIERVTGVQASAIRRALSDDRTVTPDLAAAVSAAYDRLWGKQPPRDTSRQRAAAEAHQEHAQRCGWAPPMTWHDDVIDDPEGAPADGWQRSGRHTVPAAELVEDAEWVREQGGYRHASTASVAMRLGVKRDALQQAYSRQRALAARDDAQADPEHEGWTQAVDMPGERARLAEWQADQVGPGCTEPPAAWDAESEREAG